jgi:hypothetical protein
MPDDTRSNSDGEGQDVQSGNGNGSAGPGARIRVSEGELWRVKALAAEERLADLDQRLSEANRLLEEARAALGSSERHRAIDRELVSQGATDMEIGAMMAEMALDAAPNTDIATIVADLKKRKPFLFRTRTQSASAMAAATSASGAGLDQAAIEARQTGDRGAVLRYLRMKRGA